MENENSISVKQRVRDELYMTARELEYSVFEIKNMSVGSVGAEIASNIEKMMERIREIATSSNTGITEDEAKEMEALSLKSKEASRRLLCVVLAKNAILVSEELHKNVSRIGK